MKLGFITLILIVFSEVVVCAETAVVWGGDNQTAYLDFRERDLCYCRYSLVDYGVVLEELRDNTRYVVKFFELKVSFVKIFPYVKPIFDWPDKSRPIYGIGGGLAFFTD